MKPAFLSFKVYNLDLQIVESMISWIFRIHLFVYADCLRKLSPKYNLESIFKCDALKPYTDSKPFVI